MQNQHSSAATRSVWHRPLRGAIRITIAVPADAYLLTAGTEETIIFILQYPVYSAVAVGDFPGHLPVIGYGNFGKYCGRIGAGSNRDSD